MDFDRIKNDMFISQNRKGTVPDRFMIFIVGHIKNIIQLRSWQSIFEISPTAMKRCF